MRKILFVFVLMLMLVTPSIATPITFRELIIDNHSMKHIDVVKDIDLNKSLFLMVDPNENLEPKRFQDRLDEHIVTTMLPFVEFLRQQDTTVAWATHGGKLSRNITPLKHEPIILTNNELQRIIKKRNIENVFYSGYATNVCVLMRPTGVLKNFGVPYTVYIIRDNTLAIELDETVENELVKEATIWNLELWHYKTTTIDDIEKACATIDDITPVFTNQESLFKISVNKNPLFSTEWIESISSPVPYCCYHDN